MDSTSQTTDELEDLLESTFHTRTSRLARRDLRVELVLSALVLCGALALALLTSSTGDLPLVALVVVAAYGLASRVAYPLGTANLVFTQPFLILAFVLAPAPAVPLLVMSGLVFGTLWEIVAGRTHVERVSFAGGDALHAFGPALVLLATGHADAATVTPLVFALAFAAQTAFDVVSSLLRLWVASGVRPRLQLRAMGQIAAVDAALAPLGILAALALATSAWAAVALVPLVALLAFTARDRLAASPAPTPGSRTWSASAGACASPCNGSAMRSRRISTSRRC